MSCHATVNASMYSESSCTQSVPCNRWPETADGIFDELDSFSRCFTNKSQLYQLASVDSANSLTASSPGREQLPSQAHALSRPLFLPMPRMSYKVPSFPPRSQFGYATALAGPYSHPLMQQMQCGFLTDPSSFAQRHFVHEALPSSDITLFGFSSSPSNCDSVSVLSLPTCNQVTQIPGTRAMPSPSTFPLIICGEEANLAYVSSPSCSDLSPPASTPEFVDPAILFESSMEFPTLSFPFTEMDELNLLFDDDSIHSPILDEVKATQYPKNADSTTPCTNGGVPCPTNASVSIAAFAKIGSAPTLQCRAAVARRKRLVITGSAKQYLLDRFNENRKPTIAEVKIFAAAIEMEVKQVRTWFKNMRLRMSEKAGKGAVDSS
ncbi:hypothetical protein BC830DRAFT_859618 [Chytriomyces sp. MP71]|nr:hypothetical protein BC830DRAFT_859618 [Chytriomyces sp. MP71]